MNLILFKVILMAVMLVLHLLGFLPSKFRTSCRHSETIISFMNCFAVGIFLAMALLHILPEAIEQYAEWAVKKKIKKPFPLPSAMFLTGYLLILAVDRLITSKLKQPKEVKEKK